MERQIFSPNSEKLDAARQRVLETQANVISSNSALQEAEAEVNRTRREIMQQIAGDMVLSNTDKLAWLLALDRMDKHPNLEESVNELADYLHQAIDALRIPYTVFIQWEYPARRDDPINLDLYSTSGDEIKIDISNDGITRNINIPTSGHWRFAYVDAGSLTNAYTRPQEIKDSDMSDFLSPRDKYEPGREALIIGEEAVTAFAEELFMYPSGLKDVEEGRVSDEAIELYHAAKSRGVDLSEKSEVIKLWRDNKRERETKDVAKELATYALAGYELRVETIRQRAVSIEVDALALLTEIESHIELQYDHAKSETAKVIHKLSETKES